MTFGPSLIFKANTLNILIIRYLEMVYDHLRMQKSTLTLQSSFILFALTSINTKKRTLPLDFLGKISSN